MKRIVLFIVIAVCGCSRQPPESPEKPKVPKQSPISVVIIRWDPPSEGAEPTGYRIHTGTVPGGYTETVDVGNVLEYEIIMPPHRVYLVVTAYNAHGESDPSNMITHPPVRITGTEWIPGGVRITWRTIQGELYTLESSEDLITWDPVISDISGGANSQYFDVPCGSQVQYFRIKLQ